MKKRDKILYWIFTIWLSLGMTVSGIMQLLHLKEEEDMFQKLQYPSYLLTLLGIWKLLGVIAILLPKFPLVKEWAYAGFFFTATGALFSHIAAHDEAAEFIGPALLTVLTVLSWYLRPVDRKILSQTNNS